MEQITISMEEYKELLMIKGRYEELKSQQRINNSNTTLIRTMPTLNNNLEHYKVGE